MARLYIFTGKCTNLPVGLELEKDTLLEIDLHKRDTSECVQIFAPQTPATI